MYYQGERRKICRHVTEVKHAVSTNKGKIGCCAIDEYFGYI